MSPDRIIGTRFRYDPRSGEIDAILRVPAGFGKVAVVDDLQRRLGIPPDRVVYIGDGDSDLHVMLHVNRRDGFTIAVSESQPVTRIAKRTVLSDDALSVLVPVLEEIVGFDAVHIRAVFEANGHLIQEWEKVHTDWVTISETV